MDIFLMNYDRTDLNWGLYYKDHTLRIAIIDSEMAFTIASSYMSCVNEIGPFDYVRVKDDESEIIKYKQEKK